MAASPQSTQPLTTFHRNSAELLRQLSETHQPVTLTVDGIPAAVIQDIAGYQRLLDLAALAEETEGIRQAEEDPRSRPIEEFFAEFQKRHGLPD